MIDKVKKIRRLANKAIETLDACQHKLESHEPVDSSVYIIILAATVAMMILGVSVIGGNLKESSDHRTEAVQSSESKIEYFQYSDTVRLRR